MGKALFDVHSGLYGKRPKEVTEISIDEHGATHTTNGETCALGYTILGWGIRYSLFIGDTLGLAIRFHLTFDKFRSIINA
jgi:hypothetical protein